ncbi:MAG: FadD3 family acyl-CoA ligase [Ilumatobacteraceae bacterium]
MQPPALTLGGIVGHAAQTFGVADGLVEGDRRLSFIDVERAVASTAKSFLALGLEAGDRVAIWAPNSASWMIAALGAQSVGGVLVPINTRFKGEEAAYVIDTSRASFLFCSNGFLGIDYLASLDASSIPHLRHRILFEGDGRSDAIAWHDFLDRGATVSDDDLRRRQESVRPEDLCDIIFTSGTTGRPKGVMSRHDQTVRVFWEWSRIVGLNSQDRYLIVNPFFHTFGYKAGFLACLMRGSTILPEPVFDVERVMQRIEDEHVTALPGPPTLYLSILDHPHRTRFDLSSLRLAVTGAAAIPVEMIRRMREELSFTTVLTAYGLTESTGTVTMCRPEDDPQTIAETSGRAIAGVEVRIVDDDNEEVPPGTPGEIVCRGYNVMPGYFENPEATATTIDAEGWLHTGDIGTLDERGYVRITDRKKDMYIVGGFNAYPAEIENALMHHPSVSRVAVVGEPDERMGEVGHAFVVLRPGADAENFPNDLIAWSRDRLANYKVPRRVTVVDDLPVNASGKVLKYQLRQGLRPAESSSDLD